VRLPVADLSCGDASPDFIFTCRLGEYGVRGEYRSGADSGDARSAEDFGAGEEDRVIADFDAFHCGVFLRYVRVFPPDGYLVVERDAVSDNRARVDDDAHPSVLQLEVLADLRSCLHFEAGDEQHYFAHGADMTTVNHFFHETHGKDRIPLRANPRSHTWFQQTLPGL